MRRGIEEGKKQNEIEICPPFLGGIIKANPPSEDPKRRT